MLAETAEDNNSFQTVATHVRRRESIAKEIRLLTPAAATLKLRCEKLAEEV
jgi:hypothetical protein